MPDRVEATPTPEVLAWARENAGYSLDGAAAKLAMSAGRLSSWESGEARPSVKQLRRIAALYRRPLALFYLAEPPRTFQPMHDFRRLPGLEEAESPQLLVELRRAWSRRDIALEILRDLEGEPPEIPIAAAPDADVDELGTAIREWLEIDSDKQASWGATDHSALRNWRSVLEEHGVLVFQATGVDMTEMRGFSIAERPLPVAVTNIKDSPRGRVFTVLHELVHILLRENSLCDLGAAAPGGRRVEDFCNRVAAAVLIPLRELFDSSPVREHESGNPRWSPQEMGRLRRRFAGASEETLLIRMLGAGLTSESFYRARREELVARYAQLRAKQKEDGGFVPPHRIAVASAGPTFTRLVLEGFDRDRITSSDVADFLEVRLDHLDEIRHDVKRPA